MDQELLVAIGALLDEKLAPIKHDVTGLDQKVTGLDQKVTGLQQDMTGVKQDINGLNRDVTDMKQDITGLKKLNDIIARGVVKTQDEVRPIKFEQMQLQTEVWELRKGNERIEAVLDRLEADVKVIGEKHRDHETRIGELQQKVSGS